MAASILSLITLKVYSIVSAYFSRDKSFDDVTQSNFSFSSLSLWLLNNVVRICKDKANSPNINIELFLIYDEILLQMRIKEVLGFTPGLPGIRVELLMLYVNQTLKLRSGRDLISDPKVS